MVKYTPATLKKLEDALKEYSYEVRYEKGNFRSGYCVLEAKKVVVVNKFSTLESRIQALIEITQQLAQNGRIANTENTESIQESAETNEGNTSSDSITSETTDKEASTPE
jgi:hypothetical protein